MRALSLADAASVVSYLARTAQESTDGVSWESLSYQNELLRRHDLWDGVPGGALFLADYAAVAGSRAARDLAARALQWSEVQARTGPHPDPDGRPSLGRGAAGLALAYFHLAAAGDPAALDRAAHFAAAAAALDDAALLDTAIAAGEAPYAHGDARQNPSLCHGLAGGAELLVDLFRRTGDERWLTRAHEFADRASGYRTSSPDGDVWPADEPGLIAPNLSTGAAGVGRLFLLLAAPAKLGALFQ